MRVEYAVMLTVSRDTAQKQLIFARDLDLQTQRVDAFVKGTSGIIDVAASANMTLGLGDIPTPRGLYIECDNDFQLRFNGGVETLTVRIDDTDPDRKAYFFSNIEFSSVILLNPSSTVELNGEFCVWGEPVT